MIDSPIFINGRYFYRLDRSEMCEYMINFIHKLKDLPEKYMMNSVLENFTILQIVSNRDTNETLLCIAFVFEVSVSDNGTQHHIYRLIKPNATSNHWRESRIIFSRQTTRRQQSRHLRQGNQRHAPCKLITFSVKTNTLQEANTRLPNNNNKYNCLSVKSSFHFKKTNPFLLFTVLITSILTYDEKLCPLFCFPFFLSCIIFFSANWQTNDNLTSLNRTLHSRLRVIFFPNAWHDRHVLGQMFWKSGLFFRSFLSLFPMNETCVTRVMEMSS